MSTRDPSKWLPELVGPVNIQADGVAAERRRGGLNFVGATLEDDPDNDRINVSGLGGGAVSTDNGDAPQDAGEVDTDDATATAIGDPITLASDSVTTVDVAVQCIQAGGSKCKIFSIRRSFLNNSGSVTDGTQQDLISAEEIGGSLAASVAITRTSTTVQPKVTGVAATELRWYLISQAMTVTAAAQLLPDAPIAIVPDNGDEAGGTAVVIEVTSSTGLTGAKVGGVALTGFAIDDATHVSGDTGAHATGNVDVVVTNANGDSPALSAAYEYTGGAAPAASPTADWRDYAGSPWIDSVGSFQLSEATNPATVGANFGTHPSADFDGTNDFLQSATTFASVYNSDAASATIVFEADALVADGAGPEDGVPLFGGAGGSPYISLSSSGVRVGYFDGTYGANATGFAAVSTGVKTCVQFTFEEETSPGATDGTLQVRVNGGAWVSVACIGNFTDALTIALRVGKNYDDTKFGNMRVAWIRTYDRTLSDPDADLDFAYAQAEFAVP